MERWSLLVFSVLCLATATALASECPGGCTCTDGAREIKCHLPAARSIPHNIFPKNVTKLDLLGNNILNIPPGSLKSMINLKEIQLDHNKIYFLENGAFKGASEISTLSLEDNNIHFIEEKVFSPLENLRELNIMKNQLENFPNVMKNPQLRVLSLSYNKIAAIPLGSLAENVMLEELYMKSNELLELPRNVFPEDVSNITVLNLVKNRLRSTPKVVKEMTGLEKLFLCYNPIKEFQFEDTRQLNALKMLTLTDVGVKELPKGVLWLENLELLDVAKNQITGDSLKNIEFPNLTTLNLNSNPIRFIWSFSLPALEILTASSCEISLIKDGAFATLLRLKKLDLTDNKLSSLPELQKNLKLEKLILDNNNIEEFSHEEFSTLTNLKFFSIVNNSLSLLPSPETLLTFSLTFINLSGNKFENIPSSVIFNTMPNLTSLDISRNSLSGPLYISSVASLENLRTLNLKTNGLTKIVSDVAIALPLNKLYLCGNNLTSLENGSLSSLSNLMEFTADRNQLTSLSRSTYLDNPVLKKISLASNNLQDIDDETFTTLAELSELRLVYNNLTKAPNISSNHKLSVYGLCNNPIGNLPPGALAGPKAIEVVLLRSMGMTSLEHNVFGNTRAIRYLHLALDNGFNSVPPVIRNMTSLRILKLSGNPITHFSANDFEGLNNLREIRLDNMQVKSTDVTELFPALPALRSLRLSGNPWECDCSIQWYALGVDGARARIVTEDRSMLRCSGPERLRDKSFDYLRLGDFRHCRDSDIIDVHETSASISLPYLSALSSQEEVYNKISYIPLPGREESVILADKNKRECRLHGLIPDTTYLVCVSTVTSSDLAQEGTVPDSKSESCKRFKTLSPSNETPWAKGMFGGSAERSKYLLIIYAALGGTLGVALLIGITAALIWCKRRMQRSEGTAVFEKTSATNGLNGGGDIDVEDSGAPSRGRIRNKNKTKKEGDNGEVLEMARETNTGHDNLACDVTNVAQRTKL